MKEVLRLLEQKHQKNGLKIHPPASPEQIKKAEYKIGFTLPADFKEFYSVCNGFEISDDIFNILRTDAIFCDSDYGYTGIVFAEYMIFSEAWAFRILSPDRYEIIYDDGEDLVKLTNSLDTFLRKLIKGHIFEEGGLSEWYKEIKKEKNMQKKLINKAYSAFNARDIDTALSTMHADIQWPKAFEGGYVQGHDAIRDYWTRQWTEIDPTVQPIGINDREDGTLEVTVQQKVKNLQGNVIFDGVVKHVYTLQEGLLRRMDIELE